MAKEQSVVAAVTIMFSATSNVGRNRPEQRAALRRSG
jgi:hypothetical protein